MAGSLGAGARVGNFHFRLVGVPLSGGAISTRRAGLGVGMPTHIIIIAQEGENVE